MAASYRRCICCAPTKFRSKWTPTKLLSLSCVIANADTKEWISFARSKSRPTCCTMYVCININWSIVTTAVLLVGGNEDLWGSRVLHERRERRVGATCGSWEALGVKGASEEAPLTQPQRHEHYGEAWFAVTAIIDLLGIQVCGFDAHLSIICNIACIHVGHSRKIFS